MTADDRQGRTAVFVPVFGVGAGPDRELDKRRPAFGNVVQQQRIVAEDQPCQEKQKHGPSEHESHGGVEDEPKSGCHGVHLANVRWPRLAGFRSRTGRCALSLWDGGPRVELTRDESASMGGSGTPFPVITSALSIDLGSG